MLRRLVRGYYSLRYFPRRLFAILTQLSLQMAALEQVRTQSLHQGSATLADIEAGIGAFCDDATRAMLGLDRSIAAASDRMSQVHRALMRADAASHRDDGTLDEVKRRLAEVHAQTTSIRAALGQPARMQPIAIPAAASGLGTLVRLVASVGGATDSALDGTAGATGYEGVKAAVSVGLANELRWDLEMANRGIPVLQFDPTISGPSVPNPLFTFERIAVVGAKAADGVTLDAVLKTRIAAGAGSLILKLDMDACDWSVISTSDEAVLRRFQSIVLQFRHFDKAEDATFRETLLSALTRLTQTHLIEQAWGYGVVDLLNDGGAMTPSSAEIHFRLRNDVSVAGDAQTSSRTMTYSHLEERHDGVSHVQDAVG